MLHGETRGGCAAQRGGVAAERCTAGGGAYRQQLAADHRQGVAASGRRDPLAGRVGSRQPIPPAGRGSIGASDHRQQAASIGAGDHRQGVAASGRRDPLAGRGGSRQPIPPAGRGGSRQPIPPAGRGSSRQPITVRAWQQLAADHRQQGGQGLKAAKSSHAKDESPTGILSTHIRVAAEKNFFTPRRGVIWGEKRPFTARGRKPCYDFCVGRESPPAKQKLHSADHGAERISP